MIGMWSCSMIKVVLVLSIIDGPWTPSLLVSRVWGLHNNLHQIVQSTPLRNFFWTLLLMEAPSAVAPEHCRHHIPGPEASLGNGEVGD